MILISANSMMLLIDVSGSNNFGTQVRQKREMIAEIATAREKGMTAREVAAAIHPHPTMSEGVMEALEAAYGEAVHG